MDIAGGFNANDSLGFIRVNALRLKAHKIVLKKKKPYNWRIKD
jgi:argininosuccinate synthase